VGAFFFDARGDQAVGEAIINLHSSLDAADVAAWPTAGLVRDTSIYAPALVYDKDGVPLNRPNVSQQDIWAVPGTATRTSARPRASMGILTDTRAMAWAFPTGNEDICTSCSLLQHHRLGPGGRTARWSRSFGTNVAAIGAQWQANSETAYGVDIPAAATRSRTRMRHSAWIRTWTRPGANNSTAILPFSLATAYKTNWESETGFA